MGLGEGLHTHGKGLEEFESPITAKGESTQVGLSACPDKGNKRGEVSKLSANIKKMESDSSFRGESNLLIRFSQMGVLTLKATIHLASFSFTCKGWME